MGDVFAFESPDTSVQPPPSHAQTRFRDELLGRPGSVGPATGAAVVWAAKVAARRAQRDVESVTSAGGFQAAGRRMRRRASGWPAATAAAACASMTRKTMPTRARMRPIEQT